MSPNTHDVLKEGWVCLRSLPEEPSPSPRLPNVKRIHLGLVAA